MWAAIMCLIKLQATWGHFLFPCGYHCRSNFTETSTCLKSMLKPKPYPLNQHKFIFNLLKH